MDQAEALKLKFGLRGTNIHVPCKNSVHALRLAKIKRKMINIQQQQPSPIVTVAPSSLSRLPRKLINVSRQSCGSKKIIQIQKQLSEFNQVKISDNKQHGRQSYRTSLVRNRTNTNQIESAYKNSCLTKPKKCTCGDCQQCLKDFTYFLNIFSNDKSLPQITAKSWCIFKKNKNEKFKYYYGKRIHKIRQIASLTKMITAMTAIDFLQAHNYDPNMIKYQIKKTSTIIGGQVYTLTQLLYAMMLPSGNDAAIAISEAIGLLNNLKIKNKPVNPHKQNWQQQHNSNNKCYTYQFIGMMNQKCLKIGMIDTRLFNSHGNDAFDQLRNISTCNQVAKASVEYMQKYETLKSIVNTKQYVVTRYNKKWQNTNKLLDDGFEGIKTGINQTSGPCLSAYYKDIIIIVLNSKSMNERWVEVKKLVRWILRKGL